MLRLVSVVWLCICANGNAAKQNHNELVKEVLPGIGSYFFNPTPMNWTDAATFCRLDRHGSLAYPYSLEVAYLLTEMMKGYAAQYIHVGFHDKFKEGVYYTVSGDLVSESCFKTWNTQTGGTDRNCGAYRGNYQGLLDISCNTKYPSICVNYNFFKEDYDYVPGFGYYKLHRAQRSWYDAQQTCAGEGAQLLVLNSEAELVGLTKRLGQFSSWVGVHHQYVNWQFVTINDEPLSSTGFDRWMNGEPNGTNDQKPYVVIYSSLGLGLAIASESAVYPFICEYPPGTTPPPARGN